MMMASYEETWEVAYAIGYHLGKHPEMEDTDRSAFRSLLASSPDRFRVMAYRRFDEGRKDGAK